MIATDPYNRSNDFSAHLNIEPPKSQITEEEEQISSFGQLINDDQTSQVIDLLLNDPSLADKLSLNDFRNILIQITKSNHIKAREAFKLLTTSGQFKLLYRDEISLYLRNNEVSRPPHITTLLKWFRENKS